MPFLPYLGKGTNPMKIFRVYLLSESQIGDYLVKVNKHPLYLRNEGKGANFKLIVTTADGEMTISQDGINHHLRPSQRLNRDSKIKLALTLVGAFFYLLKHFKLDVKFKLPHTSHCNITIT